MTSIPIASLESAVSERDHIRGPHTAAVTLLLYGDYESPACGQAHLIVKELLQRLGDQFRIVYRHFPCESSHIQAQRAAQASEAAAAQHRFWEMHDMLCSHPGQLDDRHLRLYGTKVGLDMAWFNHDMVSEKYAERVREDMMTGMRSGVRQAPAFFINGTRHDGLLDVITLCAAIEAALEMA